MDTILFWLWCVATAAWLAGPLCMIYAACGAPVVDDEDDLPRLPPVLEPEVAAAIKRRCQGYPQLESNHD